MPSQHYWSRGIAVLARSTGAIGGAFLFVSVANIAAFAQSPPPKAALEPNLSLDLDVIAKQLDIARNQIQPSLGASTYEFRREAIESLPQGDNAPFNQVLLQAPSVAQDSFGQLHVAATTPTCNSASMACSCQKASMCSARRWKPVLQTRFR
jgi:hypothetical protein